MYDLYCNVQEMRTLLQHKIRIVSSTATRVTRVIQEHELAQEQEQAKKNDEQKVKDLVLVLVS